MAFKNRNAQHRIVENPCEMCGTTHVARHAAHIVDERKDHGGPIDWNALSLCPNCHTIFDEKLRPKLCRALAEHGVSGLPASWSKSNKLGFIVMNTPEDRSDNGEPNGQ